MQIIGSAFAAGFAWVILEFVGRPLRKFFDLRGEIIRKLVEFANVKARWKENRDDPNTPEEIHLTESDIERLERAQVTFRDLAAQMSAFAQNETFARWCARVLQYRPEQASSALVGLSNSYDTYGDAKSFQRRQLYDALRIRGGPSDVRP